MGTHAALHPTLHASSAAFWLGSALPGRPHIIAGPCSAESETQVLQTAAALAALGIATLRVGIWKPRTRPGTFEGIGAEGLAWIRLVQQQLGMQVVVEVANTKQVEEALGAGVDGVWIGARTTVSPFSVQEIADALRGTDTPVMVKNPINPELALWMGAFERLIQAGLTCLAACHRGFSFYGASRYRNIPQWEVPLELRRQHPSLPLLCDPSHIAGKRELVQEVAQKALDLGFDGLIVESHIDPASALSDAAQQLSPAALDEMLATLTPRQAHSANNAYANELEGLRTAVDEADHALLDLIRRRLEVIHKIGELKRTNGVQYYEPDRMNEVFASRAELAQRLGLSESLAERLFKLLHAESLLREA